LGVVGKMRRKRVRAGMKIGVTPFLGGRKRQSKKRDYLRSVISQTLLEEVAGEKRFDRGCRGEEAERKGTEIAERHRIIPVWGTRNNREKGNWRMG